MLIEEVTRSTYTTRMCGISSPRMLDSTIDEVVTNTITTIIIAEMIQGITREIDTMTGGLITIEVDPAGTTIEMEAEITMVESDTNVIMTISITTKRIRNE